MNNFIYIFILILCASTYSSSQDITNGRVAYYPFNGNADDDIGINHGTAYGVTLAQDRFGIENNAFYFDGMNDFIEIPHSEVFNFGVSDSFSISFWIKIENQVDLNGNNDIISKWNAYNSSGYPYAIRFNSETAPAGLQRQILIRRYDSQTCNNVPLVHSTCELPYNEWLHVVYVKAEGELLMYENGTLVSSENDYTNSNCNTKNTHPVLIGKRALNQRHFKGYIDDIAFYDRAISFEEIQLLFTENNWSATHLGEANILSFSLPEQTKPAFINKEDHLVTVEIPCKDITQEIASFNLSEGAIAHVDGVEQISGVSVNDFSQPLTYSIYGQNCSKQEWIIEVKLQDLTLEEINSKTLFHSFAFTEQVQPSVIDSLNSTIKIWMPCNIDLTQLTANFTTSSETTVFVGGIEQFSALSSNDFSEDIIYTVVNRDSCAMRDWIVQVTHDRIDYNEEKKQLIFESFNILEQVGISVIDINEKMVKVEVSCNVDVSKINAMFKTPENTYVTVNDKLQSNGITTNDFSESVIYVIHSDNNCFTQEWIVSVFQEKVNMTLTKNSIPNIVTPNEDGKNDTWQLPTPYVTNFNVHIYNRWGNLVFFQYGYDNNWGGENLSPGLYFYSIYHICDINTNIKGWLNIVK
ncbi:hypothetical protein C900_04810 [Fulvivirga imtechensis AK7]|uniref:LamG-like jellyroll fold domain-containing protein n=1 Tax=Fulvivirga imtechensis AK7 TaxID=1237149 RepID=L8JL92_9BACT|nr:LamG-like jellyroll fold domain-containing protein [Fulvivirga imtechensis]ELR69585.1 hypothetical protein C900_04810 [Fulvivirga imtechensis AK7]